MDEWKPAVSVLALCAAILGAAAILGGGGAPAAGPTWEFVHHDSRPVAEQDAYRESWILLRAPGGPLGDLTVWIDGEPIGGAWDPGPVRCATFTALYPEQDFLRPIELRRDGGVVWSGVFGSGAGTPTTPACQ